MLTAGFNCEYSMSHGRQSSMFPCVAPHLSRENPNTVFAATPTSRGLIHPSIQVQPVASRSRKRTAGLHKNDGSRQTCAAPVFRRAGGSTHCSSPYGDRGLFTCHRPQSRNVMWWLLLSVRVKPIVDSVLEKTGAQEAQHARTIKCTAAVVGPYRTVP